MAGATSRVAIGLATAAFAALVQSAEPARYAIKQSEPDTGTRIPSNIVEGSRLPLDKRYAELTPEQQKLLKSQYEQMGDADEPPFPANGLGPLYRQIARGQQKLLARGPLTMFVDIDATGTAIAVQVLQSPDPQATRYVAAVLMEEKYKPALCDGTPCRMQFPFRIDFRVR